MEDRALETLATMLRRRKIDVKAPEPVNLNIDKVKTYTLGPVLVIISQKDKLLEKDVSSFIHHAEENQFNNGVIIISLSRPSEAVLKFVKQAASKRVQFFFIKHLQFDITQHRMISPHRILSEDEKTAFVKKFNVRDVEKDMPLIDSQDPMAQYIGALPGDIVEIMRHTDSGGAVPVYRYCVADVNIAN